MEWIVLGGILRIGPITEFLQTSRIFDGTSGWCDWTFRIACQTCLKTVLGFTRLTSHCGTVNWNEIGLSVSAIVGTTRICWTGLYIKRPPFTWYHWSWKPRYKAILPSSSHRCTT
eukprot:scaffold117324_cov40-Attheya_sp.AAC.1